MLLNYYLGEFVLGYRKLNTQDGSRPRIKQMTTVIIITGLVLAIVGAGVAIWSIVNTRKKYYDEYMRRKGRADD